MTALDRIIAPQAMGVATLITGIIAGWFALTFVLAVGEVLSGA